MRKLIVFLALVSVGFAPAESHGNSAIHADTEAAHRYWQTGTAVPEPADATGPCRGRWNVVADDTLSAQGADGAATGLGFTYNPTGGAYTDTNGNRYDWQPIADRCEFSMSPRIEGGHRRCVVAHEIGHFIHGPWHRGPMAVEIWHQCVHIAWAVEAQQRIDASQRVEAKPRRRTRKPPRTYYGYAAYAR